MSRWYRQRDLSRVVCVCGMKERTAVASTATIQTNDVLSRSRDGCGVLVCRESSRSSLCEDRPLLIPEQGPCSTNHAAHTQTRLLPRARHTPEFVSYRVGPTPIFTSIFRGSHSEIRTRFLDCCHMKVSQDPSRVHDSRSRRKPHHMLRDQQRFDVSTPPSPPIPSIRWRS